jgi:hypothetical protein
MVTIDKASRQPVNPTVTNDRLNVDAGVDDHLTDLQILLGLIYGQNQQVIALLTSIDSKMG